jgi:alkylation response protein AidB-like acyl-CoA dehydrogenase
VRQPDGTGSWFMVDAAQPSIHRESYRLVDGCWAADVHFAGTTAELLQGGPASAGDVETELRVTAIAGYIAEALGAAEAALTMAVQYLRARQQFGQPLGEFQTLRHRVAEMYIAQEQARSAAEMALEAATESEPHERIRRASQAQLVASEALTWMLQQAIQLHGGMGMTEELPVGHFYRRMLVINALTGGARRTGAMGEA